MPTLLEHVAARAAFWHAKRVYARFRETLADPAGVQQRALRNVLSCASGSDYGNRHALDRVRSLPDLKHAAPLVTYDDLEPLIERVAGGETSALLASGQQIRMFATSSGTTARPKLIPVTAEFVAQYRRGWNTFGLKLLSDHPKAILRAILQSSSRHDERYTSAGVPCGAITGLLARTQKRIVRRFYAGVPEIAHISDPSAKYYALMRFAIVRDVAFAITASPATLIRMAETANQESERLLRDVRDGTLSPELLREPALRRQLERVLKPAPERAKELARLRSRVGSLRPRDYWQIEFLACWTGGSMGHYLQRLADWWGPVPVRDIGLLASEGRITMPLEDGNPAGVLDTQGAVFEFIPADRWDQPGADTLAAHQLETGRDYAVVLSNCAGLVRYRLDDVVRVCGWMEQTPLLEFLHRAGRVASIAGEKLTENQVVAAVRMATTRLGLAEFDFLLAPRWGDPPFYQLTCTCPGTPELLAAVDHALGEQNAEYKSRRKSLRLGMLRARRVPQAAILTMDLRLLAGRGSSFDQYKRPCLLTEPGQDEELLPSGEGQPTFGLPRTDR